ncbi:hypothetical protein [Streptomyces sp. HSG2]|uniref:hypothetical protein n=1 Tax=Streptomyces sp. HSG2 TaxID=2797167 RepID=UPI001F5B210A|nr:hypothetical protein [Streptomyces sp. HSG2]
MDGGIKENNLYAVARIEYSGSVATNGEGTGNLNATSPDWDPPGCWYAPYLGAKAFKKEMSQEIEDLRNTPGMAGHAGAAIAEMERHYTDEYAFSDTPGYDDYNVDKDGEGMFWAGVENPNEPDLLKRHACSAPPFWVENGEAPPPQYEQAITPEILAALAYQQMTLPETDINLAPETTTKVNLPTWIWLDNTVFTPVQATASLNTPGFTLQATTTATPVSLTVEPGTPHAQTHPTSGTCPIQPDGTIGRPYTQGNAEQTPPCGLTYHHSSGTDTYPLQATVTWQINWTGTGNAGGDLPNGTIEETKNITVQEIQSLNR